MEILSFKNAARLLGVSIEDDGGPQRQEVFVNRFIPNFKAYANLDKSVYFPEFFRWMGETRELSAAPILNQLHEYTATGRWGLVTNNSTLQILGENISHHRIVRVRLWSGHLHGPSNSTQELFFEWCAQNEAGEPTERIAFARMKTTWVEILGHGLVKPAPFPEFYYDFMKNMVPRNDAPDALAPLAEPLKEMNSGDLVRQVPNGPRACIELCSRRYETHLYDSNLVGNIYFSNYAMWMAKTLDGYFQALSPELYRGIGELGTLKTLKCNIDHLREAMPYDTVVCKMFLRGLYKNSVDLYFEFYKELTGGQLEKLAFGNAHSFWIKKLNGQALSSPLPGVFANPLRRALGLDVQLEEPAYV